MENTKLYFDILKDLSAFRTFFPFRKAEQHVECSILLLYCYQKRINCFDESIVKTFLPDQISSTQQLLAYFTRECNLSSSDKDILASLLELNFFTLRHNIDSFVKGYYLLSRYDHHYFSKVYPKIISHIFEQAYIEIGQYGEYGQPKEITSVVSYILSKEGVKTIYNPYAGIASFAIGLSDKEISYLGQDLSQRETIYGNLLLDAYGYTNSKVMLCDTISSWQSGNYDCVVANIPSAQIMDATLVRNIKEVSFHDDFFFYNCIKEMPAHKIVVGLTLNRFCLSACSFSMRQMICESGYLDTIIEIPGGVLPQTALPSNLIILRNYQHDTVKFIKAKLVSNEDPVKKIDSEALIKQINGELPDGVITVRLADLKEINYTFASVFYVEKPDFLKPNQNFIRLKELVEFDNGEQVVLDNTEAKVITAKDFKANAYDVWSKLDVKATYVARKGIYRRYIGPHIVVDNSRKGIIIYQHKGEDEFYSKSGICLKVNTSNVLLDYLVYCIFKSSQLSDLCFVPGHLQSGNRLQHILNCKIVVDQLKDQQSIVNKERQQEYQKRQRVLDAERKRLNLKEATSDLVHMLGTPLANQSNLVDQLHRFNVSEINPNYVKKVQRLLEVSSYIQRIVKAMDNDFSKASYVYQKVDLAKFVENYVTAWQYFGTKDFKLSLMQPLQSSDVNIDTTMFSILFDTVLDNARRHAFLKEKDPKNKVEISLSHVSLKNEPYAKLSIANNGVPFNDAFGVNSFIERGRFDGKSGRTGLGGNHIYAITQNHRGFLNIHKDTNWGFILDILIPLVNDKHEKSLNIYEYEVV